MASNQTNGINANAGFNGLNNMEYFSNSDTSHGEVEVTETLTQRETQDVIRQNR
jgi:hypothetical protein